MSNTEKKALMLTCPYCQTEFELSWGRYWRSPFDRHVCPRCRRKSKLTLSSGYMISIFCVVLAAGIPGILLAVFLHSVALRHMRILSLVEPLSLMAFMFIGGVLTASVVGLPVDRWMAVHLRCLEPITGDIAADSSDEEGYWVVDE